MYWDFLDELTPESAVFLSYLVDVKPIMKKWDGEYFRLANSFVQERFLTWSHHVIKTRLDELVAKGFISVKEMYCYENGSKGKTRWVKINDLTYDLINDLSQHLTYDLTNDLTENFGINYNTRLL